MAISNLLPRKTMGSKSLAQTLRDRNDYDQNPAKTENGELVTSYECVPESAADEFLISKQLYEAMTGRSQPKKRDIIMYRKVCSTKQRQRVLSGAWGNPKQHSEAHPTVRRGQRNEDLDIQIHCWPLLSEISVLSEILLRKPTSTGKSLKKLPIKK